MTRSPTETDRHRAQLEALADFGSLALRSQSLDPLLEEAMQLVARGCGTDHVKILERLPDRTQLLVRAGLGWAPGVVGRARIGADLGSAPGFALRTGLPVVSPDHREETRFRLPDLLARHGIRSSANVIIQGDGEPFGVLEMDSTEPRSYSPDEVAFLQCYANLLAAAIDRQSYTARIAVERGKQDLLLTELQHRVKNGLQMMISLLDLQQHRARSEEARGHLETVAGRLEAMRLMYGQLYLKDHHGKVELGAYLRELAGHTLRMTGPEPAGISLDVQAEEIMADLDVAVPIGLIVNEFLVNSVKHAFPDGRGTLQVRLTWQGPKQARLALSDDGRGIPREVVPQPGSGLALIAGLAGQIGARAKWQANGLTRLTLAFAV